MTTVKVDGAGKKARQAARPDGAEVVQAAPTAARPTDANGREIDEQGLPLNGPARAAALAAMNLPDPDQEPQVLAKTSETLTAENGNG